MNRRSLVAKSVLFGIVGTWQTSSLKAAEGITCDRFHVQEQAQHAFDEFPDLNTQLVDPATGIVCPLLPSYQDVAPPGLETAILDSFFAGGNKQNVISFDSGREVSLAGLASWGNRQRDYPPGVCTDFTYYLGGPAAGFIPKLSPVIITNHDGSSPTWKQEEIDRGICWVWDGVSEPICLNLWLIEQGAGILDVETVPSKWKNQFASAELRARTEGLGVWGECEDPEARTPMMATFAPVATGVYPKRVVRVGGDWGERITFDIPESNSYSVTATAPTANSYLEIALFQNTATGQEYPEFYWTIFGPQVFTTTVWMEVGTYVIDCRAAGGWSFEVQTIPV